MSTANNSNDACVQTIVPQSTALLVLHYQTDILSLLPADVAATLLANTRSLLDAARTSGVCVFFAKVGFSAGYPEVNPQNKNGCMMRAMERFVGDEIPAELVRRVDTEPLIVGHRASVFFGTNLEAQLRAANIDTLLIAGIASSGTVLSTVAYASDADYRIVTVKDCCFDPDPIVHERLFATAFETRTTVLNMEQAVKLLADARTSQAATTQPLSSQFASHVEPERSLQRIEDLVSGLQLSSHPEGGFYRRIFESPWMLRDETALHHIEDGRHPTRRQSADATQSIGGALPAMHFPRPVATSIYFLLTREHPVSHLHRLPAEEQWVWIEGDPLLIVQVDPSTGEYSERLLGPISFMPSANAAGSTSAHHALLQPCSTAPKLSSAPTSLAYPTHVVPGGVWFGARLCDPAGFAPTSTNGTTPSTHRFGYSLVSCVVSPGFQFEDFRLMGRVEFDALRCDEHLRQRLVVIDAAATLGAASTTDLSSSQERPQLSVQSQLKLHQLRAMVLNEETRGMGMQKEATAQATWQQKQQ